MRQSSILGYKCIGKSNGVAKSCNYFLRRFFNFSVIDCFDLSVTVSQLLTHPRHNRVYAIINLKEVYSLDNKVKTPLAAFAILYDVVDSFVVRNFEDLQEDIDPLINQRMYNDEYRRIFLEVENSLLYEELDEILSYSMLSNIDGLIISNPRLLKYAAGKSNGCLMLIAGNVASGEELKEYADLGVKNAIVSTNKISFLAQRLGRKIEKRYRQLLEQ